MNERCVASYALPRPQITQASMMVDGLESSDDNSQVYQGQNHHGQYEHTGKRGALADWRLLRLAQSLSNKLSITDIELKGQRVLIRSVCCLSNSSIGLSADILAVESTLMSL